MVLERYVVVALDWEVDAGDYPAALFLGGKAALRV